MYKRAYNHIIHPVPDHSQWEPPSAREQELPLMLPPIQKENWKTKEDEVDEVNVSGKVTRQWTLITCSNCGSNTHNKRKCNRELHKIKSTYKAEKSTCTST